LQPLKKGMKTSSLTLENRKHTAIKVFNIHIYRRLNNYSLTTQLPLKQGLRQKGEDR